MSWKDLIRGTAKGGGYQPLPEPRTEMAMPEFITANMLSIRMVDGSLLTYQVTPWGDKDGPINSPWMHFYKWYLNREGSPAYIMKGHQTEDMIRRVDIKSFNVRTTQVLKHG